MNRRNSIRSMIAMCTAPAIIELAMLMPVKVVAEVPYFNIAFLERMRYECRKIKPLYSRNQNLEYSGFIHNDLD